MNLLSHFRWTPLARCIATLAIALPLASCGGSDDDNDEQTPPAPPVVQTPDTISLKFLGRQSSGEFDVSAAEIPTYDAATKRGFVVNARKGEVDVFDLTDPSKPKQLESISASVVADGAEVNSISIKNGVIALAVQDKVKTNPGYAAFYNASTLAFISKVTIGALPDMITFTPDGKTVLVANEGEPSDDYQIDPEGSIAVIDVSDVSTPKVRIAGFAAWNGKEADLREKGVRIYGPGANAAKDFEPEYIAVSADGKTAWVTLQENNAFAKIDIASATVTDILPLGFKDLGLEANAMDAADEDGEIRIQPHPGVRGMYLPDAVASYTVGGKTYLVTANEGDTRAWGEDDDAYWGDGEGPGDPTKGFVEEFRVKHLVHSSGFARRRPEGDLPPQLDNLAKGALLNPAYFAWCGATPGDPGDCRADEVLGRLTVSWTLGYQQDADGKPVMYNEDGEQDDGGDRIMYDHLYAIGGRSFSIWDEGGKLVWDSGSAFEKLLASDACKLRAARDLPCKDFFNSGHDEGDAFDSRSDAKGPEPEGIEIGKLGDKTFVFVGLERMGGIVVYDITDPTAPFFVDYLNTREDWTTEDPEEVLATAGDLGPEGLKFVPATDSPTGRPMLIVGNEVSGTTSVYDIEQVFKP